MGVAATTRTKTTSARKQCEQQKQQQQQQHKKQQRKQKGADSNMEAEEMSTPGSFCLKRRREEDLEKNTLKVEKRYGWSCAEKDMDKTKSQSVPASPANIEGTHPKNQRAFPLLILVLRPHSTSTTPSPSKEKKSKTDISTERKLHCLTDTQELERDLSTQKKVHLGSVIWSSRSRRKVGGSAHNFSKASGVIT